MIDVTHKLSYIVTVGNTVRIFDNDEDAVSFEKQQLYSQEIGDVLSKIPMSDRDRDGVHHFFVNYKCGARTLNKVLEKYYRYGE